MEMQHEILVAIAKSWGLFYLLIFSVGVMAYAFWPSNHKRFQDAKQRILDQDDRP